MAFPRPLVFTALYGLFLLCFVLTPLWNTLPGLPLKAAFLAMTLAAGFAFAWWGSGGLRSPTALDGLWFLLVFAFVLALNFSALSASIPWRGDEDFNISFTSQLSHSMGRHLSYFAVLAAFLGWGAFHRAMDRRMIAAAILFGALAAFAAHRAHLDLYQVLRYPILMKYLTALPVYLASLPPPGPFPEIPYRIIPLICGAGLAWLGFRALARRPLPIRVGAALAVATLPLVRYYGTLFYLEMPAALCMTLVCFQAGPLLRADLARLVRMPSWYALILIGFIKETGLPFLAAFLACRLLFHLHRHLYRRRHRLRELHGNPPLPERPPPLLKEAGREAVVVFCVAFPLCLYLFYRFRFGHSRSYNPEPQGLLNAHLLFLELRSWWDSFGLLLPLALAGALPALRKCGGKRRQALPNLVFPALAFFLVFALFFLDGGLYVGYSRFNLFLLPSLLALAWEALRYGAMRHPALTAGALALIVAANAFLSPVNADGSKLPRWGIYGNDIGDHYYPYREALLALKRGGFGGKARLTGLYYAYPTGFYLRPEEMPEQSLVAKPDDEAASMDSLLAASADEGFEAVLYHIIGDSVPALPNLHGYGNTQVFRNRAHALVLFTRPRSPR
jgi:hypothetical protein